MKLKFIITVLFCVNIHNNFICAMDKEDKINDKKKLKLPDLHRYIIGKTPPISPLAKVNKELQFARFNFDDMHNCLKEVIKNMNSLTEEVESLKQKSNAAEKNLAVFFKYKNFINLLTPEETMKFAELMTARQKKQFEKVSWEQKKIYAKDRIDFLIKIAKSGNIPFIIALRDFAILANNKGTGNWIQLGLTSFIILKSLKLISKKSGLHIKLYIKELDLEEVIMQAHTEYLKFTLGIYHQFKSEEENKEYQKSLENSTEENYQFKFEEKSNE